MGIQLELHSWGSGSKPPLVAQPAWFFLYTHMYVCTYGPCSPCDRIRWCYMRSFFGVISSSKVALLLSKFFIVVASTSSSHLFVATNDSSLSTNNPCYWTVPVPAESHSMCLFRVGKTKQKCMHGSFCNGCIITNQILVWQDWETCPY
jgi:hypothetical protein